MLFQDYKTDSHNRSLCVSACMRVDNARRQDLMCNPFIHQFRPEQKELCFQYFVVFLKSRVT